MAEKRKSLKELRSEYVNKTNTGASGSSSGTTRKSTQELYRTYNSNRAARQLNTLINSYIDEYDSLRTSYNDRISKYGTDKYRPESASWSDSVHENMIQLHRQQNPWSCDPSCHTSFAGCGLRETLVEKCLKCRR